MAAYFLLEIEKIIDKEIYWRYLEKSAPILEKFGAENIFRTKNFVPLKGNWELERIVLIKFPNKDVILKCFESEEYKSITQLREDSIQSKSLIIEDS